jgi:hypothetical protein
MKTTKRMKSPVGRGRPSRSTYLKTTDGPYPPGPFVGSMAFTSFVL